MCITSTDWIWRLNSTIYFKSKATQLVISCKCQRPKWGHIRVMCRTPCPSAMWVVCQEARNTPNGHTPPDILSVCLLWGPRLDVKECLIRSPPWHPSLSVAPHPLTPRASVTPCPTSPDNTSILEVLFAHSHHSPYTSTGARVRGQGQGVRGCPSVWWMTMLGIHLPRPSHVLGV